MVASIKINGEYKLTVINNRIKVDDNVLKLSDIPYVRYDMEIKESTKDYIKDNMKVFDKSMHLLQINLSDDIGDKLELIKEIQDDIAIFIYIDIDDKDINSIGLLENRFSGLSVLNNYSIDRVMLRDKSTMLSAVTSGKIIKIINELYKSKQEIGVCSSPLSFSGNNQCISATTARKLAAVYYKGDEIVVPSSNHQSMNRCGCIRYFDIDEDIMIWKDVKKKGEKGEKSSNVKESKNKGIRRLNF